MSYKNNAIGPSTPAGVGNGKGSLFAKSRDSSSSIELSDVSDDPQNRAFLFSYWLIMIVAIYRLVIVSF
jgi:hypothetical protein